MKPLLIILDDWEGRIAQNPCWGTLQERIDILFLPDKIANVPDEVLAKASFLMAVRERTPLTKEVFDRLPNLKLILQTGGHAYHIDQAAAESRGIAIALGRRIKAPLLSVPELTMAMILGTMHRLPEAMQAMRTGGWPLLTGRTLSQRRLGILGMGRHGSKVALIASAAFNMEVVAWDRPGSSHLAQDGFPRLPLAELLATSDVVSIHLRLSAESKGLLSTERLSAMKPGTVLINTSRGEIIDEPALIEALQSGHIAGAGLDVFAQEPLPEDSVLRTLNNVILTPHIGWTVEEVFDEFAEIACTQLQQYLDGQLPDSELLAHALH